MRNLRTTDVLGYQVYSGKLSDLDLENENLLINTMSPNSYGLALKDSDLEIALKGTDVLVLDGIGIALGSIILNGRNIKKIAGQDCFDFLMDNANSRGWKVFFLGSTNDTLQKIIKRASIDFPNVHTGFLSPPFKSEFEPTDNLHMFEIINDFKPDVLFVGLTAPKQEKWAYQNRTKVDARIISTIGNVFDWYAGNSRRPSKFWINLRLEWLARIFMRPEILKRNTGNQMLFIKDVLTKKFKLKKEFR